MNLTVLAGIYFCIQNVIGILEAIAATNLFDFAIASGSTAWVFSTTYLAFKMRQVNKSIQKKLAEVQYA